MRAGHSFAHVGSDLDSAGMVDTYVPALEQTNMKYLISFLVPLFDDLILIPKPFGYHTAYKRSLLHLHLKNTCQG